MSYLNWKSGWTFLWASNDTQGLEFLIDLIKSKGNPEIQRKINEWLKPLQFPNPEFNLAEEVLKNITVKEFAEKGHLMNNFESKVTELRELMDRLEREP